MTTVQESTNGHRVFPPPCSLPHPQEETQGEHSTNNNFNATPASPTPTTETFPANAYHVPPKRFAPRAYPYRRDDMLNLPPETEPLPQRCQLMFSDGRQCTMARSDIHPSLCTYHSEREEQLFGTPGSGRGAVVGGSFDLAELYSASADLTTAAGVSRALAQVFRLLAQRRISRQEAATFAKLGHLLLQSISAARSSGESHPPFRLADQELSPVNKVHHERGAWPARLPHEKVIRSSEIEPEPSTAPACGAHSPMQDQPTPVNEGIPGESLPIDEPTRPVCAPSPSAPDLSQITQNQQIRNANRNSNRISTYRITEDKTVQNQHMRRSDQDRRPERTS